MSNFFSKAGLTGNSPDKRRASFAGTWYEADEKKLRAQLNQYFKTADETLTAHPVDKTFQDVPAIEGAVLAIVSPHAGYMFSGQTAAFAYKAAAKNRTYKRIFLLGPSHYVGFHGAALPSEKSFATPLGDLQLDRKVLDDLGRYPGFETMPEVHRREHSLEMQLPLIKEAFGNVTIVPIIIGMFEDPGEVQTIGHLLRQHVTADDLIIVSSDFTHFGPRYGYEPFHEDIRENVRKLDGEAYECLNHGDVGKFFDFKERTQDTICGFFPCAVLLSMLPEHTRATLLQYKTSQDIVPAEDKNSVSYLAIAFSNHDSAKDGWIQQDDAHDGLSEADQTGLLKLARQALETFVRDHRTMQVSEFTDCPLSDAVKKPMGVFVTLYKRGPEIKPNMRKDDKELRGCIGYIFPVKPLAQAVIENAIGAASRDPRFHNVTEEELNQLQIDVNVLTTPKRIRYYNEIVIGRDGILLYKDGRQAVFLPSVATEFGWNLEETLSQLSMKAGFDANGWKNNTQFDVFQSIEFAEPNPNKTH